MHSRLFPANSASDCLRFAKFRPQFSESCGTTYRRICEMFSALQSTSALVTDFENSVQIDAYYWRRYRSSNWYEIDQKTRFYIWRSIVAPPDAIEKNRNIGAQPLSILYTNAQKRFWKIYFLYDFWCAQTCSFRVVFGLPIRTFTLAVSAM